MIPRPRPFLVALGMISVLSSVSRAARADEPAPEPPLRWDAAWTHAGVLDYALTGVGLVSLGTETVLLQDKTEPPRWIGPILFDTPINTALRGRTQNVRSDAETASWVLWFTIIGYPLAVDVPHAWIRYGRNVAWDLFWQDATALSLSGAVDVGLRDSIARLRPGSTQCINDGGTNCENGPEAARSFPSGHESETTTATALICTQHLMLHLYGAPWDAVTCVSAIAADGAVGVVKLVADDHWATDILAGAALGVAFGWGVPVVMHLHGHAEPGASYGTSPSMLVAPVPIALSHGGGIGLSGLF